MVTIDFLFLFYYIYSKKLISGDEKDFQTVSAKKEV